MGRDVLRRRDLGRERHYARRFAVAGCAHHAELDDRRDLYVSDRRGALAGAKEGADPALAGNVRADAARRDLFVSGGVGEPRGDAGLTTGWIAVFAIEVVLYVVGAAFIVLVLAKDRAVNRYKAAAETDPLTSLLNRRGFFAAAAALMNGSKVSKKPVSVLAFDLDHFKSDQRPLRP